MIRPEHEGVAVWRVPYFDADGQLDYEVYEPDSWHIPGDGGAAGVWSPEPVAQALVDVAKAARRMAAATEGGAGEYEAHAQLKAANARLRSLLDDQNLSHDAARGAK